MSFGSSLTAPRLDLQFDGTWLPFHTAGSPAHGAGAAVPVGCARVAGPMVTFVDSGPPVALREGRKPSPTPHATLIAVSFLHETMVTKHSGGEKVFLL